MGSPGQKSVAAPMKTWDRSGAAETRLTPCAPLFCTTPSVWATFAMFYGMCTVEYTWELKLKGKKGKGKQCHNTGKSRWRTLLTDPALLQQQKGVATF